jgi:hypothetical protein
MLESSTHAFRIDCQHHISARARAAEHAKRADRAWVSMFGMSFTYAVFAEGADIYGARTRVLEQLAACGSNCPWA